MKRLKQSVRAKVLAAVCALTVTMPAFAQLPSVGAISADLVDPGTAHAYYASNGGSVSPAVELDPYLEEIAFALGNDIDNIYEYVRNRMEIAPAFGVKSGAAAAVLNENATNFEQIQLFVQLVRLSGYSARYQYGQIELMGPEFEAWFGTSGAASACRLLANGGIPAEVNDQASCSPLEASAQSLTKVVMAHLWAEVQIGGAWYAFDPSFKPSEQVAAELDAAGEAQFSYSSFLASAGAGTTAGVTAAGSPWLQGVSPANVNVQLDTFAGRIRAAIEDDQATTTAANDPLIDRRVDQVLGGSSIVETFEQKRDAALPYAVSSANEFTWANNIPSVFKAQVRFRIGGWDETHDVEDVYLKRMATFGGGVFSAAGACTTVTFLESDWLGGQRITQRGEVLLPVISPFPPLDNPSFVGNTQVCGSSVGDRPTLALSINHPYAAQNGSYADETVSKVLEQGLSEIVLDFGFTSERVPNTIEQQRRFGFSNVIIFTPDIDFSVVPASQVTEESLQKNHLWRKWSAQFSLFSERFAQLNDLYFYRHHSVGLVTNYCPVRVLGTLDSCVGRYNANPAQSPAIRDQFWQVQFDLETRYSVQRRVQTTTAQTMPGGALSHVPTLLGSLLEGAVLKEQYKSSETISTSTIFAKAAENGTRFYDLTTTSQWTGVRGGVTQTVNLQLGDFVYANGFDSRESAVISDYLSDGQRVILPHDGDVGLREYSGFVALDVGGRSSSHVLHGTSVLDSYDVGSPQNEPAAADTTFGPNQAGWRAFKGGVGVKPNGPTLDLPSADLWGAPRSLSDLNINTNIAEGSVAYTTPTILSDGTGDTALGIEFTFGTAYAVFQPFDSNYTHNHHSFASVDTSILMELGSRTPRDMGRSIAFLLVVSELYNSGISLESVVFSELSAEWFVQSIEDKILTINIGSSTRQLVDRPGLTEFVSNDGATAQVTGACVDYRDIYRDCRGLNVSYRERDGTEYEFDFAPYSASTVVNLAENERQRRDISLQDMAAPYGRTVTYDYNGRAQLERVVNNFGRSLTFEHNGDPSPTDPQKNALSGIVDSNFRRTSIDGTGVKTFTFPDQRELEVAISGYSAALEGFVTAFSVGQFGINVTIGNETVPIYQAYGTGRLFPAVLREARDARETKTTYRIVPGYCGTLVDPYDVEFPSYFNKYGELERVVRPDGYQTQTTFDGLGRAISEVLSKVDEPAGTYYSRKTMQYDRNGNVVEEAVHSRTADFTTGETFEDRSPGQFPSLVTSRTWDLTFNKLKTEVSPNGNQIVSNVYDPTTGLLDHTTGPEGERIDYSYNAFGQVTTETTKLSATESVTRQYFYYPGTFLLERTVLDPGGLAITEEYDYSDEGYLEFYTNPRGNVTSATYDEVGRIRSIRTPLIAGSDILYNGRGQPREVQTLTINGTATTTVQYTPTGQIERIINPEGDGAIYSYDLKDRIDLVTGADCGSSLGACQTVEYRYDDTGRVEEVIEGVGSLLEQGRARVWYDAFGEVERLRTARGIAQDVATYDIQFEADEYGRTGHLVTYADGSIVRNMYRPDGLVRETKIRHLPASGAPGTVEYEYDQSGRVEIKTDRDPGGAAIRRVSYLYDLAGRLESQTESIDDTDVVSYLYDKADRVRFETANGRTVEYRYDAAGNRTDIVWPDGVGADYRYDADNRLISVDFENQRLVDYIHDRRDRLQHAAFGNGVTAGFRYDEDDALRLVNYSWDDESGAGEVLQFVLGRSPENKLVSETMTLGDHAWQPDEAVLIQYSSNSLPGEAANALDQYETVMENYMDRQSVANLSYDERGNMISRSDWTYAYDYENRMISAIEPGKQIEFDYDPLGRRTALERVGMYRTEFLHAGDMEIAEYDDRGVVVRRYIPGGSIDERVAYVEGSGTTDVRYYHANHRKDVVAITDSTGAASERYAYDAFGNEMLGGAGSGQQFRFTGRKYDIETELYYFRARYYSPDLGRFLQTDPVGYADQWNLYTYVSNNPISFVDPTGACTGSYITNDTGSCQFSGGATTGLNGVAQGVASNRNVSQAATAVANARAATLSDPSALESSGYRDTDDRSNNAGNNSDVSADDSGMRLDAVTVVGRRAGSNNSLVRVQYGGGSGVPIGVSPACWAARQACVANAQWIESTGEFSRADKGYTWCRYDYLLCQGVSADVQGGILSVGFTRFRLRTGIVTMGSGRPDVFYPGPGPRGKPANDNN